MPHKILVPFEIPDAEPLSPVLVRDLASIDVVALGHYALPEQTPPEAAREQFLDDAQRELDELTQDLRRAGATVTTRVVFGKDRAKTIDRVAVEEGCDAELDPAPTERVERILVPLVDAGNLDRLTDFVTALVDDETTEITLFHVVGEDEDVAEAESMLERARSGLIQRGFAPDPTLQGLEPESIHTSVVESNDHKEAILRAAADYDAVVMDETDPDVPERIFGTLPDRIRNRTGDPVIVVRRNI
jgi:nucleotide-binding universal stress UspA family protein